MEGEGKEELLMVSVCQSKKLRHGGRGDGHINKEIAGGGAVCGKIAKGNVMRLLLLAQEEGHFEEGG